MRIKLVDLWQTASMAPWAYPIGTGNWIQSSVTTAGVRSQDFYAPGPLQPDIEFLATSSSADRQPFRVEFFENESTTPTFVKIVTIRK